MKSIAITKPDTGVLSQKQLHLSPFGALAQAFAEELLARSEQREGHWPFVPLELLNEGTESSAPPAPALRPTLHVDLHLVLEALRREENRSEQRQATERIVDRILQLQSRREPPPRAKKDGKAQGAPPPPVILGTLRQTVQQNLTQNLHVLPPLFPASATQGQHAPGEPARLAGLFLQQLPVLQREGSSPAGASGPLRDRMVLLRPQGNSVSPPLRTNFPAVPFHSLPREALTFLNRQDSGPAQTADGIQAPGLLRTAARLQPLMEKVLEVLAKPSPEKAFPATEELRSDFPGASHHAPEPGRNAFPAVRQTLQTRDIRMTPALFIPIQNDREPRGLPPQVPPHSPGQPSPLSSPPERSFPTGSEAARVNPAPFDLQHAGKPPLEGTPGTQPIRFLQSPEKSPKGQTAGQFQERAPLPAPSSGPVSTKAPSQVSSAAARPLPTVDSPSAPLPGAARDIRTIPEALSHREKAESPAKIGKQTAFPQSPMNLSLRTEPEKNDMTPVSPGTRQAGASPSLADGLHVEKAPYGERPSQPADSEKASPAAKPVLSPPPAAGFTAAALPVNARDIRITPGIDPRNETADVPRETPEQVPLPPLPLELSLLSGPEDAAAAQSAPGIQTAGRSYPQAVRSGQDVRSLQPSGEMPALRLSQKAGPAKGRPPGENDRRGALPSQPATSGEIAAKPATRPLPTAARDIRMKHAVFHKSAAVPDRQAQSGSIPSGSAPSPQRSLSGDAGQADIAHAAWTPSFTELVLNRQAGSERVLSPERPQSSATGEGIPPPRRNARETVLPEPVDLTYGPARPAAETHTSQQAGSTAQPQPTESDYVRSLPDWARRFLGERASDAPSSRTMAVARNISSLAPETEDTVQWTAPGYRLPEAPIAYREKHREEQPRESGQIRISDAEIQRTADQVYRMIEERIRRERRRLGL